MSDAERQIIQILTEMRDSQREELAYRRRTLDESLALSRLAVQRQEQMARLYRRALGVCAILVVALGFYLAWVAGAFR